MMMTNEIVVDLGDWGPCDVRYTVIEGDPSVGEPDFYEYDVIYAGDEDGSRKGEEISGALTDAEHNQIIKEIQDHMDREY
jgi:hypothetical protein